MAVLGHSKPDKDRYVWADLYSGMATDFETDGLDSSLFPAFKSIAAKTIGFDLVPVVPMDPPRSMFVLSPLDL